MLRPSSQPAASGRAGRSPPQEQPLHRHGVRHDREREAVPVRVPPDRCCESGNSPVLPGQSPRTLSRELRSTPFGNIEERRGLAGWVKLGELGVDIRRREGMGARPELGASWCSFHDPRARPEPWHERHQTLGGADKRIFTTGEAAAICKVSQQTIIRCFDSGRLTGFRVPGSKFRRIPREELIRFMRANGIPLDPLEGERRRVLIVDDDQAVLELLVDIIQRDGRFEIKTASNGYDAGLLTESFRPSLILLDYMLPDLNGNVVCQGSAPTRRWPTPRSCSSAGRPPPGRSGRCWRRGRRVREEALRRRCLIAKMAELLDERIRRLPERPRVAGWTPHREKLARHGRAPSRPGPGCTGHGREQPHAGAARRADPQAAGRTADTLADRDPDPPARIRRPRRTLRGRLTHRVRPRAHRQNPRYVPQGRQGARLAHHHRPARRRHARA